MSGNYLLPVPNLPRLDDPSKLVKLNADGFSVWITYDAARQTGGMCFQADGDKHLWHIFCPTTLEGFISVLRNENLYSETPAFAAWLRSVGGATFTAGSDSSSGAAH